MRRIGPARGTVRGAGSSPERAGDAAGHEDLHHGTTTRALSGPVQVTGLTNATQVAAGAGYSLAIHETLSIHL